MMVTKMIKMKAHIYILFALIGFSFAMSSCSDDEELRRTLTETSAPELYTPDGTLEYLLTKENAESPFETFIYSKADYGLPIVVNYTIELDKGDGDFSAPVNMQGASTATYQSVSIKDFNLAVSAGLGCEPEVQTTVQARVKAASSNSNVDVLYSNVIELTVTPYDATIPPIYAVGDATAAGWSPQDGVEITATGVNLFEAVIELEADPKSFRFLGQNTGWGPVSYFYNTFDLVEAVPAGSVDAAPVNDYGEINFMASQAGTYKVVVNLDNGGKKTIKFTKQ